MSPVDHTTIKKQTTHLSNSYQIKEHYGIYCSTLSSTEVETGRNDRLQEEVIHRKLASRSPFYPFFCEIFFSCKK